jgi:segregation and condensation protein A
MSGRSGPEVSSVSIEPLTPDQSSGYAVKLPVFEGPLDLLLHLIRLNEVDITDIAITGIAEQYLEYLALMEELDIDVAGEYLLMAATLAWIKSRMLLPVESTDEEDEGIDPRAELVARLLEYQRFKEAAGELGELPLLGRDVFRTTLVPGEERREDERELDVGLYELLAAMRAVLEQSRAQGGVHEIEAEPVTVRERMILVMETLAKRAEPVEFIDLFCGADGQLPSRTVIVATFLAILELARLAALRLYQGRAPSGVPEGPIRVRRVNESRPEDWAAKISELM